MKQKDKFGSCAAAPIGLLRVCAVVAPVGAEGQLMMEGATIVGSTLQIDETKGIDCCSATGAHSKRLIYTPGTTYRIAVLCEYKGGNDAIGQTAQSWLEGPDGAVDTKPIWEAVKSTVL
jgi:hypothetical protein